MAYDDAPFYTKMSPQEEIATSGQRKPTMPWVHEVRERSSDYKRAITVSPLLSWWTVESAKRAKGEDNEIDRAEILAAVKGSKNVWYKAVKTFPDEFEKVAIGKGLPWADLVAMRNGERLKPVVELPPLKPMPKSQVDQVKYNPQPPTIYSKLDEWDDDSLPF